ncbi:HXXEE domain-containing protein [Domibacillus epiphyticus]|uniref:HXXEE domain-containing protein n=1 Tax=Domibacillus epiphyticus TaxID=1714355 RepID=A0A1V2AA81_9BACI|nr:HXXEE domain-containing protein [Domibacillus epiphyticus]OMP67903.1 hypothetical protein BTO28_05290 [Domibacillus epiphyticus]
MVYWLIPILFLLHNVEESFGMTAYLHSEFQIIISQPNFNAAISILTVIVFMVIFLFHLRAIRSIYWIVFIQGAILLNSLQHVLLWVSLSDYNPGLISAIIILLFSVYLLHVKKTEVSIGKGLMTLLGSLIAYPLFTWSALWMGGYFIE